MQSDATNQQKHNMKTIDTRDLYKRKCELEILRDAVTTAREELEEAETALADHGSQGDLEDREAFDALTKELEEAVSDAKDNLEDAETDFGDDEKTELDELETLESEIADFGYGETMVLESDFEDYARHFAEGIHGKDVRDAQWPFSCIDWERAARELAMDYTTVEYQGEEYLVRA